MEHVFFRVRGDAATSAAAPAVKAQPAKRLAHQQHLQPLLAPPAPPRPLTTPDESAFERHRRRDADEAAAAAEAGVQQQQRQRRQLKDSGATASPAKRSTLSPIRSPSKQQLAAARRRAARHAAAAAAGSHHGRDGPSTATAAPAPSSSSSWPHSSDPTHERSLSTMSSSSMQGDEYAQLRREEVLVERQVDEALFAQQRAQVEAEMAAQAARARGEDRRAQADHKDDSAAPAAAAARPAPSAARPAPPAVPAAAALTYGPAATSTFDVPASELVDLDGEEDAEPDDPFDEQKCLTTPLNVKSLMQFMKPVNSSKKIFPQQD
jgi:hypothetical protein